MSGTMQSSCDQGVLDRALDRQRDHGWVTEEDVCAIADETGMPPSKVYETLSFYSMIHLAKPVTVKVQVCRGTSCYTRGGMNLLHEIERLCDCAVGETSPDGTYQVDYVECIGHCETAPNIIVNGVLYQAVTPDQLPGILKEATR